MRVSPCGWFCFKEPTDWIIQETPESILMVAPSGYGRIELTSAYSAKKVLHEEVMEMHESMVREFPAQVKETIVDRTDLELEYISSTVSDHQNLTLLVHLFWSHYCVFVRLDSSIDQELIPKIELLDQIVFSTQPLTID